MSEDDAFLRKLLENPADDNVRLVYADWLEEQENPTAFAKAKFLRLQTEQPKVGKKQRKVIKQRLQTLATSLSPKWLAVVSKLVIENCESGGTRVGFLDYPAESSESYLCPKKWENLQGTDKETVRFCASCKKQVYFCDDIESARDHVVDGDRITIHMGINRKQGDLESESDLMGLIGSSYLDREEERRRIERERRRGDRT